jgi:hypothetical protein
MLKAKQFGKGLLVEGIECAKVGRHGREFRREVNGIHRRERGTAGVDYDGHYVLSDIPKTTMSS